MAEKKYKVGYTCGAFNNFHVGYLNLSERCKETCDSASIEYLPYTQGASTSDIKKMLSK